MTSGSRRLLNRALQLDFLSFLAKAFAEVTGGETLAANWHHEAIAHALDQLDRGDATRLIVTMPPRNLKSIAISVAWPAWMLGRDPALSFVCVSYSSDLALKHARDCRAIMRSDWYRRAFPRTLLAKGAQAENDVSTTAGGGRLSTSVGGTLTGRGGDIIIIDDPVKPDEAMSETVRRNVIDWYKGTLTSRLNDKTRGRIVLVMQRLHEEDLAGYLLESSDAWKHLSLPAIAEHEETVPLRFGEAHRRREGEALHEVRESPAALERLRKEMGGLVFSAQYQQSPIPAEGNLIKRDWFRTYDRRPDRLPGDQIVQSWDTASREGVANDWSVCVTVLVRDRTVFVLDVFRKKLNFPDLKKTIIERAVNWRADVLLIEDASSGTHLLQQLWRDEPRGVPRPIARKPETDKITRAVAASPRIEAGEVLLPTDEPWLDAFLREVMAFPNGRHDDQVDALSQLLIWMGARIDPWSEIGGAPELIDGGYY